MPCSLLEATLVTVLNLRTWVAAAYGRAVYSKTTPPTQRVQHSFSKESSLDHNRVLGIGDTLLPCTWKFP